MKALPSALLLAFLIAAGAGCGHPFIPATPPTFVDLGDRYRDGEYRATTADGVVIGIRAFDNDPKGEPAFWGRTLERRMRETGGYALIDKRDVKSVSGLGGVQMRFGHDEGKEPYLYYVALYVTDKKVYLLEVGGTKSEIIKQEANIEWAIRNFAQK